MTIACHYCSDACVVGGAMPWANGTTHITVCPYCDPGASPLLKFKPTVTPFTGSIMPVPGFTADTDGMSVWVEPDMPGERVIIVADTKCRMWCWSDKGRYVMDEEMLDELTLLATHISMDGWPEYGQGMAFEGLMCGEELWLYLVLPLTSLLDGADDHILGGRRFDLKKAVEALGPTLSYRLMPTRHIKCAKTINTAELDAACDEFGVDAVMVKQIQGYWGKTPCWTRYEREADF